MPKPNLVLEITRNKYSDMQFFGFVNLYKNGQNCFKLGEDNNEPFFLRSLAKPIQASIMADLKTNEFYNLKSQEIAISCASHTGDKIHTDIIEKMLSKAELNENYLKCGVHHPIGNHNNENPINNNCSGKHTLMLLESKQMGYELYNYYEIDHPIQKLIYEKHKKLAGVDFLPSSTDGCSVPIYALSFDKIIKAFSNIFFNSKYDFIKEAFLNNPLIIGGEKRLDTLIMQNGENLIAKVGAGGFLIVINLVSKEILLIKMAQDNNSAREILAQEILLGLGWIKTPFASKEILTNNGKVMSEYKAVFKI